MVRTFHAKLNKKTLFFCLLPGTVLAVYFFWVKEPLIALCFMVFLVFVVERLIHTAYVFTDDGFLLINLGRFSKTRKIALSEVEKIDVVQPFSLALLKDDGAVMLTMRDGSTKFVTPFPVEEFCKYFNRRKQELMNDEG